MSVEKISKSQILSTNSVIFEGYEDAQDTSNLIRMDGRFLIIQAPSFKERHDIDLHSLILPPSGIYEHAELLIDHPELFEVALKSINVRAAFLGESKSMPETLRRRFMSIVYLLEHGWLRGLYRATDWTPAHFQHALEEYCKGGWRQVLGLRVRGSASPHAGGQLLREAYTSYKANRIGYFASEPISDADEEEISDVAKKPFKKVLGYSVITSFLYDCNALAEAAGLPFRPFTKPTELGRKLGKPRGRSETVGAADLAELTRDCYVFYMALKETLINLFRKIHDISNEFGIISDSELAKNISRTSEFIKFKESLPTTVTDEIDNYRYTLNVIYMVVESFHIAALYLLGFMNARRPDEVSHKTVGVRAEDVELLDSNLHLYRVNFYLEKGPQMRVPFYVNELSFQILRDLDKLSSLSPEWMPKGDAECLFSVPDYRHKVRKRRVFKFYRGNFTERYNRWADFFPPFLRPYEQRGMRRGYAMLFHYRYIHGSVPALQHQLGHANIQETFTYITNTLVSPENISKLFGPLSAEQSKARDSDLKGLAQELRIAGEERLLELVKLVIERDPTVIGGFSKLIRRLHRAMSGHISYAEMDAARQSIALRNSLVKRGNVLYAMREGDCWRGESLSKFRGSCQQPGDVGPRHANVKLEVCNSCAYQTSFLQHTRNLEEDEANLQKELSIFPAGSLSAARIERSLAITQKVIRLRQVTRQEVT